MRCVKLPAAGCPPGHSPPPPPCAHARLWGRFIAWPPHFARSSSAPSCADAPLELTRRMVVEAGRQHGQAAVQRCGRGATARPHQPRPSSPPGAPAPHLLHASHALGPGAQQPAAVEAVPGGCGAPGGGDGGGGGRGGAHHHRPGERPRARRNRDQLPGPHSGGQQAGLLHVRLQAGRCDRPQRQHDRPCAARRAPRRARRRPPPLPRAR